MNRDDIQTRIDIVYSTINKFRNALERNHPEEVLISFKLKLEAEEHKLSLLKRKHPEYFI